MLEKENWTHLNLPAIAEEDERMAIGEDRYYERKEEEPLHPERESLATLARIKEAMGSYAFAAQYQQRPSPLGGGMVHWKWFQRYADALDKLEGDLIVQSWDTASKSGEMNDFCVCTT